MGLLWMFVGMPIAMFVGIYIYPCMQVLVAPFRIGAGAALAYDAYNEKDRRHCHHLTWADNDESPD